VDVIIVQDLGLAVLARELGVRMDVHASTQMNDHVAGRREIRGASGVKRVVVGAGKASMREIASGSGRRGDPGAGGICDARRSMCVAYSGQCLTSEALGQRSANRGECAQACRLPYELVVDGALKDFGRSRYLLSPRIWRGAWRFPS